MGAEVDEPLYIYMTTYNNTHPQSNDCKMDTQLNERKRQKRGADNSLILSDDEADGNFPSFIVVEATNTQNITLSIFGIQKLLRCAVGEVKSAKKLRNGSVLVEVCSKAQADRALKMTTWVDVPVKASPHRSLNSSKGVIRCRDFRDCDDVEVLDALRSQGVTTVKHIMSKKNGKTEPTNTFIVTFNLPTPPKFVKAAYMNLPVEPFIPNPLRCYNCQGFGHGQSTCKRKAVCARCGLEGHSDNDCHEQPHCVNCSGPHPSFSKECPEWIKQRSIVQIKTEKNISFNEAKQLFAKQHSVINSASSTRSGITYASVCKATATIATQTDLTWPLDRKIPISTDSITPSHQNTEIQTNTASTQSSPPSISNIPRYSSTPRQKIQLNNNSKPGPASSKQGLGKKPAKGSNDPITLYNRYGSLDSMDQEVELSPGKGPGGRKNR